ncbi:uncharacterized protein LOC129761499 [Toxorhynchites rutilus septentrionalis]|uniref:uncharacterized protein LOC129761499 n=1 Tax=Toxorhynchites rutilus septentrionalis TaxID=329112 RepID=UPI002478761D|nr:uncharacterized protein LOC129761499 [Toxorhynchites rutilus septentrionalis]
MEDPKPNINLPGIGLPQALHVTELLNPMPIFDPPRSINTSVLHPALQTEPPRSMIIQNDPEFLRNPENTRLNSQPLNVPMAVSDRRPLVTHPIPGARIGTLHQLHADPFAAPPCAESTRPDPVSAPRPSDPVSQQPRPELNPSHPICHPNSDPRASFQPQCTQSNHQGSERSNQNDRDEEHYDPCPLTRKQLAARQAISRDLPMFSGNPEEWPLFLSTFNSTTMMCGFTDEENIVRLQRSLKGRAYEAVKCRLMHPSNVTGVISTLKMLFGQPEVIISSLIRKINSLPPLKEDKLETLVDFAVHVENFCATVDACGLEEYFYNVTFLHQLVSKLPPAIKLNWAQHRQTLPMINLPSFSSWLYTLAEAASAVIIPNVTSDPTPVRNETRGSKKWNSYVNAHSEETSSNYHNTPSYKPNALNDVCPVCKGTCKWIAKCKHFIEFSRDARWATVRDLGLCRRCLRRHNGGCQAKLCGKNGCELKHHELLHNDQKNASSSSTKPVAASANKPTMVQRNNPSSPGTSTSEHGCHTHQVTSSRILFRYIPIVVQGKHGLITTFAFLDDGSALTLLDNDLADELMLEGEKKPLCLQWTGGAQRREDNSRSVSLTVAAAHRPSKQYTLNGVRTVDELLLPPQTLNVEELRKRCSHLNDLPIASYEDVRPRILIGMKDQHLSLVLKSREGTQNQPIAVKTRLGWTICGGGNQDDATNLVHSIFHVCPCEKRTDEDLHKAMKEYFAIDSLGVAQPKKTLLSAEDERAQFLLESTTVLKGGRYETGLLWRYDSVRLPDSRSMALRRLQCLKTRMDRDPQLADALNQKISEFVTKGYARKLSDEELKQPLQRVWYLPTFPVTNINKPGKIRIVWDAAASAHGFREGRIGLTGDVREMFLQVLMRLEDQHCQRFFWYDEEGKIVVYVLQVMSFGACCSPSSAQYVKNVNAERFKANFPAAVEVIQKRHYVDDMLVSVESEDEAIRLAQQVKKVHSKGGFEICNWISNSKRVIAALQVEPTKEKNLDLSPELATEKVLGMWWCTKSDTFPYKVGWTRYGQALLEGQRHPTKREMLRVLMSMFDPLGLIAHLLMYLKALLQDVWRSGIGWDDEISDSLFDKWQTWLQVLPKVEKISIPRCYRAQVTSDCKNIQLHTFVDAGDSGVAAACYLRFSQYDIVECSLVAAKTRVAPLKYLSTPRLELQAALIGSRLARSISGALSIIAASRLSLRSE